uniref:Uncharacterized protein n=1 Tax=Hanusia phi TaxID=3032 RepID=A0A7S0ENQ4_9CRYP|mmetsp:Transcript_2787/g.6670  ORF Transcript_2787/g.6670 Transcript_2787/m.6670 type:complete len:793 (+) Transcript_2787:105-2483(+)|eukprot:768431-Hanusia_phi.AAC.23
MAVTPITISDYRVVNNNQAKQGDQWQWVWDPSLKKGKWQLVENPKQQDMSRPAAARQKVTMQELEESSRKAVDARAAKLRKETARRLKQKDEIAKQKEWQEELRIRKALEERRAQMEENRSLITAGPRVKPVDVRFDDVVIPGNKHEDGIVARNNPNSKIVDAEKPVWNSGVGPGSGAQRVGYQPPSLIPPPTIITRDRDRWTRPTSNMLADSSRNGTPSSASARTRYQESTTDTQERKLMAKNKKDFPDVDEVLAKAERGIERAREFNFTSYMSSGVRHEIAGPGHSEHPQDLSGMQTPSCCPSVASGRTSPSSIGYWNDNLRCEKNGSEAKPASAGKYRRRVDAVRGEIEHLKKFNSGEESSSHRRATSPTGSVISCRSNSTAASARTTNSHYSQNSYRGQSARQKCPLPQAKFSRIETTKGVEEGLKAVENVSIFHRRQTNSRGADRYKPLVRTADNVEQRINPLRVEIQEETSRKAQSAGTSRVRGGLAAAKAQAALLDSLDLESPAHRAMECDISAGTQEGRGRAQAPHESLLESLDLSGSNQLSGILRTDQWLRQAVNMALGVDPGLLDGTGNRSDSAVNQGYSNRGGEGHLVEPHRNGYSGMQHNAQRGVQRRGDVGQTLRKSIELLNQNADEARTLVEQYRRNKLAGAQAAPHHQPQPPARRTPMFPKEEMEAVEEEESRLMASIARLDLKLAGAADSAGASVAGTEYRRADERDGRERRAGLHDPVIRKEATRPLEHWNVCDSLYPAGTQERAKGSGALVPKRVPSSNAPFTRDRRIAGCKNK